MSNRWTTLIPFVLAAVVVAASAGASAGSHAARGYGFTLVTSGLTGALGVTTAPGDSSTLYVTEQGGTVAMVRGGKVVGTFLDLRDRVGVGEELGLLGIAFHPLYVQNHLVYVDYTDLQGNTHVVEYSAPRGVVDTGTARELLFVQQPYPNHKGGQLAFDAQGRLYVGMGDGGTNPASGPTSIGDPEDRAQNMGSMLGKLLRIDPLRSGDSWQIIGMGLRNPWRFSFDRSTGNLWIADVGAAKFEEIDFRPKAKIGQLADYGWSRFEGNSLYNPAITIPDASRLVKPVYTYSHNGSACAVIGGAVYRGVKVPAARGRYFFGDLCSGVISTFKVGPKGRASTVATLPARIKAISSFGQDGRGELYAVTTDGFLFALH